MARNRRKTGRGGGRAPEAEQEPARLTVALAGRQEVRVAVHRATADPPASVNVLLGRAQMVVTDPTAAEFVAARWSGMAGLAGHLPAEWERTTPAASAGTSGDAITFRITDQVPVAGRVVRPRGHTCWLQIRVGPVQFSVRDTTAFRTTAVGLRNAAEVARAVLPEAAQPTRQTRAAAVPQAATRASSAALSTSGTAARTPAPAPSAGSAIAARVVAARRPERGVGPGAAADAGRAR